MRFGIKYHILSIIDTICNMVRRNSLYIIILSIIFVIGLVVGVIATTSTEDAGNAFYSYNWLMACYANNQLNLFAFFFLHILFLSAVIIICAFLSYSLYVSWIYIAITLYLGMCMSGTITLMFMIFGIMSLAPIILGYIIFELIFSAYLIIFISFMFELCWQNYKYGRTYRLRDILIEWAQVLIGLLSIIIMQTIILYLTLLFII